MSGGYGNCYPKTDFSSANYVAVSTAGQAHMAVVANLPTLDQACVQSSTIVASNGDEFTWSCNSNRVGNDLEQVHAESFAECIDACATYDNVTGASCVGSMYDSTLLSGWQNCWLKSAAGTTSTVTGNHFGLKTRSGTAITIIAPKKSSRKAWIAGVVVAIIALIAILGFAFWYFRRRHANKALQPVHEVAAHSDVQPGHKQEVYQKSREDKSAIEIGGSLPLEPVHEIGDDRQVKHTYNGAIAPAGDVHEMRTTTPEKTIHELS